MRLKPAAVVLAAGKIGQHRAEAVRSVEHRARRERKQVLENGLPVRGVRVLSREDGWQLLVVTNEHKLGAG